MSMRGRWERAHSAVSVVILFVALPFALHPGLQHISVAWTFHLDPADRLSALVGIEQAVAAYAGPGAPAFLVGDANIDWIAPRSAFEFEVRSRLEHAAERAGLMFLPAPMATCMVRGNRSSLDCIAIPLRDAWRLRLRASWETTLMQQDAELFL